MSYGLQIYSANGEMQVTPERPVPFYLQQASPNWRQSFRPGVDEINYSLPAGLSPGQSYLIFVEPLSQHFFYCDRKLAVGMPTGGLAGRFSTPTSVTVLIESAGATPNVFIFKADTAVPGGGSGFGLQMWGANGDIYYNSAQVNHLHFSRSQSCMGWGLQTVSIGALPGRPAFICPSYGIYASRQYFNSDPQDDGTHEAKSLTDLWMRHNPAAGTITLMAMEVWFDKTYTDTPAHRTIIFGAQENTSQLLLAVNIDTYL